MLPSTDREFDNIVAHNGVNARRDADLPWQGGSAYFKLPSPYVAVTAPLREDPLAS